MARLTLRHLQVTEAGKITNPSVGGHLDLSKEGICPKTGEKMIRVKLVGVTHPQTAWYNPRSRVCLPMSNPELL